MNKTRKALTKHLLSEFPLGLYLCSASGTPGKLGVIMVHKVTSSTVLFVGPRGRHCGMNRQCAAETCTPIAGMEDRLRQQIQSGHEDALRIKREAEKLIEIANGAPDLKIPAKEIQLATSVLAKSVAMEQAEIFEDLFL